MSKGKIVLYWIIHIIWGFPTFLVGSIVAIVLLYMGSKPQRFGYGVYFTTDKMKGCGFSIGPFFVLSDDCKDSLSMKQHEHGHGIQTLWWGPIMGLVISIPSAIRFWWRELQNKSWAMQYSKGTLTREQYFDKFSTRPKYDAIWFEHQAGSLGEKYFKE